MVKRYTSFVLRCWRLEGDQRRIEVEHVQSGVHKRVRSLAAAVAWIDGRWTPSAEAASGTAEQDQTVAVGSAPGGAAGETGRR